MSDLKVLTAANRCGGSAFAAGDVLRGDDDAAGRVRDADGLPAEQLQGAAAAVHGPGVLLLHRHRGGPHARYRTAAQLAA